MKLIVFSLWRGRSRAAASRGGGCWRRERCCANAFVTDTGTGQSRRAARPSALDGFDQAVACALSVSRHSCTFLRASWVANGRPILSGAEGPLLASVVDGAI